MKLAATALNSKILPPSMPGRRHENGAVTSYSAGMNDLFEKYAIDDVVVETDAVMTGHTKPATKTPLEYAEPVWLKAFQYDRVYKRPRTQENFHQSSARVDPPQGASALEI